MKTAMQELIDWTRKYEGKMISADQVVLKAFKLLLSEKEDLMDSFLIGFKDGAKYKNMEEFYDDNYESFLNQEITWTNHTTQ
jgi:hypothetical protein